MAGFPLVGHSRLTCPFLPQCQQITALCRGGVRGSFSCLGSLIARLTSSVKWWITLSSGCSSLNSSYFSAASLMPCNLCLLARHSNSNSSDASRARHKVGDQPCRTFTCRSSSRRASRNCFFCQNFYHAGRSIWVCESRQPFNVFQLALGGLHLFCGSWFLASFG